MWWVCRGDTNDTQQKPDEALAERLDESLAEGTALRSKVAAAQEELVAAARALEHTDELKAENKLLLDELATQEKATIGNAAGKTDADRQLKRKEAELEEKEEEVADLEGKLKSVTLEVAYLKDKLELVEQEGGKSKAAHADAQQQLESNHDNTVCVFEWRGWEDRVCMQYW